MDNKGMSLIVKTVTRLTFGLAILYGIYIAVHGHISPGGGFAGGVILALAFTNLLLAFGKDVTLKKLSQPLASFFGGLGGIIFITIAVLGYASGHFFINFIGKGTPFSLFSAGMIPIYNVAAILIKVSAGLFSVLVALVLLKVEKKEDKK